MGPPPCREPLYKIVSILVWFAIWLPSLRNQNFCQISDLSSDNPMNLDDKIGQNYSILKAGGFCSLLQGVFVSILFFHCHFTTRSSRGHFSSLTKLCFSLFVSRHPRGVSTIGALLFQEFIGHREVGRRGPPGLRGGREFSQFPLPSRFQKPS